MKPYYQDQWVTIYHGDAMGVLSHSLNANCLITDPPYGLGELSGTTSKMRNKNNYESCFVDDESYIEKVVIPTVNVSLSYCNGRGLITPGVKCMFLYPRPRAVGGFFQPAAVGMCPWGFAGYNPVLFYGKDPRDGKGQSSVMTKLTSHSIDFGHPCSKPLKAMEWMVTKGSLEGETILDPFMGSGTTLRAAKDWNRKAIGIEIEEKYCEIAALRMSQEVFDLTK